MKIEDMPLSMRIEAASAYQAAKSVRQIMFQLMKLDPAYAYAFAEYDQAYQTLCANLDVPVEAVFDKDSPEARQRFEDISSGRIA